MPLTGADIINGAGGVRVTLIDASKTTWSDAELLDYLNQAIRATCFEKPDTYTLRDEIGLVAGTEQTLPTDAIALLDIYRNSAGSGGDGRVVTQVDEALLEEANRFWPAATQQTQVEHFTADPRDPRRFTVFPPNNGAGAVEVLYGAVPAAMATLSAQLPVADSYESPFRDFMLAYAYAKSTQRQDLAKTGYYMQSWARKLGIKTNAQMAYAPKVAAAPGTTA